MSLQFHLLAGTLIIELVFKPPLNLGKRLKFLTLVFELCLFRLKPGFVNLKYLSLVVYFLALAEFDDKFVASLFFHFFLVDLHI